MKKRTDPLPATDKQYQTLYQLGVLSVIIISLLFAYWQVCHSDFINYDDPLYVTDNPLVQKGMDIESVKQAFSGYYANFWHPLTIISHMMDVELYGFKPAGHHVTNLILHVLNTVLLFLIIFWATRKFWPCALIAALFALHPTHVESVAWISERKDLLSTFLGLISLLFYLNYVKHPNIKRYIPVFGFMGLSLMAKSTLVTLPFMLLLLDYWPLNRYQVMSSHDAPSTIPQSSLKLIIVEKIPLLALSIAFSAASYLAQEQGGAVSSVETLPLSLRGANACWSYIVYIGKTFWPVNLAFFYPYPSHVDAWKIMISLLVLIIITGASIRLYKKMPYFPVGWLLFLGTLFPVIGLVPVGLHAMADRYLYVAHIGLFISIGFGIHDMYTKMPSNRFKKGIIAASMGICVMLLMMTRAQVGTWKNSTTLFSHAIEVTKKNFMAHHLLAHELSLKGDYQAALTHLKKSIRFNPNYPDAYNNLAVNLFHTGQIPEAMNAFNTALRLDPEHFDTLNNAGLALFYLKQYRKSAKFYQKALAINPGSPDLMLMIGKNLTLSGQPAKALPYFKQVLDISPGNTEARQYRDAILNHQDGKTQ